MESNFPRFMLAAGAVALFAMIVIVAWKLVFGFPLLDQLSVYQWALAALLIFMFTSFMGGLLVAGVAHATKHQGVAEARKFLGRMGILLAVLWVGQRTASDIVGGTFGVDTVVAVVFLAASIAVGMVLFCKVAFKPIEAEAA